MKIDFFFDFSMLISFSIWVIALFFDLSSYMLDRDYRIVFTSCTFWFTIKSISSFILGLLPLYR
jgi:hypothetical protein